MRGHQGHCQRNMPVDSGIGKGSTSDNGDFLRSRRCSPTREEKGADVRRLMMHFDSRECIVSACDLPGGDQCRSEGQGVDDRACSCRPRCLSLAGQKARLGIHAQFQRGQTVLYANDTSRPLDHKARPALPETLPTSGNALMILFWVCTTWMVAMPNSTGRTRAERRDPWSSSRGPVSHLRPTPPSGKMIARFATAP